MLLFLWTEIKWRCCCSLVLHDVCTTVGQFQKQFLVDPSKLQFLYTCNISYPPLYPNYPVHAKGHVVVRRSMGVSRQRGESTGCRLSCAGRLLPVGARLAPCGVHSCQTGSIRDDESRCFRAATSCLADCSCLICMAEVTSSYQSLCLSSLMAFVWCLALICSLTRQTALP